MEFSTRDQKYDTIFQYTIMQYTNVALQN